jgi:hypothetical protein
VPGQLQRDLEARAVREIDGISMNSERKANPRLRLVVSVVEV